MPVTFSKLKSGEYGVRAVGVTLKAEQSVSVTKKSGESSTVKIKKILWTGPDRETGQTVQLAAIYSDRPSPGGGGGSDCCGYPCPVSGRRCTPSDPCHDCQ